MRSRALSNGEKTWRAQTMRNEIVEILEKWSLALSVLALCLLVSPNNAAAILGGSIAVVLLAGETLVRL